MKKWFKILKNNASASAAEIQVEIEKLRAEQLEVKARLSDAGDALDAARMSVYGGEGKQSDVDILEGDVKALQNQADTLEKAIADMGAKLQDAKAQERQKQIDDLDKKMADLRHWVTDIKPDFIKTKVKMEAYERLLSPPAHLAGYQASRESLMITGKERAQYQKEYDEIVQGHGSITVEIDQLKQERDALAKQ